MVEGNLPSTAFSMDTYELKNKTTSVTATMLDGWLRRYLKTHTNCSFDVETTGLDAKTSEIFSYCIGHADGQTEVYRLDTTKKNKDIGWRRLKEFFADPSIGKIAHNFKFELHFLRKHGVYIHPETVWHDTMLMSRILRNLAPSHTLEYLCWEIGDYKIDTPYGLFNSREIDKKVSDQAASRGNRYDRVDKELMYWYQVADAERPSILFQVWEPEFRKDFQLYRDYISEVQAVIVTQRMETLGIRLHWEESNRLIQWLEAELEKAQQETYELLGEYVNLNSEPQLIRLLYRRLGLPVLKKTKTGRPATDKTVILDFKRQYDHPILNLILKTRSYTNARSTLEGYLEKANDEGDLYPTVNSCQARTHRQSSENPNMQNVGKGLYDEESNPFPVNMRRCFRAKPGHFICLGDYAGIEMRLIIELADSIKMIEAMKRGENPHDLACKLFYEKRYASKKESKTLYSWGKNGHFALGYGAGPKKIRTVLKMETLQMAKEAYARYHQAFPEIADLSKNVGTIVKRQGYIETKFGNRLSVARAKAYSGLNYLIQCTAAKILKRAEINVDTYLKNNWSDDVRLMMVIHDEVLLDFPREYMKHKDEILYNCGILMCDMPEIQVPLEVEWKKTLLTWDQAQDYIVQWRENENN